MAVTALVLGALPNLPGFLHAAGVIGDGVVPVFFDQIYTYAWFIGFGIAGVLFVSVMGMTGAHRASETP